MQGGITMWSDIISLVFAILGIVFVLMVCVLRIMVWRTEDITITIPLYDCDKSIFNRIYNLRSGFDFGGMKEKCTIVIINYGAPEFFCNEILSFYEKYNFLRLVHYYDIQDKLF